MISKSITDESVRDIRQKTQSRSVLVSMNARASGIVIDLKAGLQVNSQKTFAEAYSLWIDEKREKVSNAHYQNLSFQGEGFWLPFFANVLLEDLTPEGFKKYLKKRRSGTIVRSGSPFR